MIQAEALDQVESITTRINRRPARHCHACGRVICFGHTEAKLHIQDGRLYVVCWECGEAIIQHLGFAGAAEFPTTPPYGGGINRPTRTA